MSPTTVQITDSIYIFFQRHGIKKNNCSSIKLDFWNFNRLSQQSITSKVKHKEQITKLLKRPNNETVAITF